MIDTMGIETIPVQEKTVMSYTYEAVIDAAMTDFEGFFYQESGFKIKYKFVDGNFFAKISGNTNGETILFSKYLADQKIFSIDDIMFCLIIIGHELAHYVNKHNSHKDTSNLNSVAIETWAEFFGARIMFTLITKGSAMFGKIENIIAVPFAKPAPAWMRQDILLKACGRALRRAYDSLYKQTDGSAKYPNSSIRVLTFIAGISSFFARLFGGMKEDWTLYVYKRVLFDNLLADATHNLAIDVEDESSFQRIVDIHIKIKGRQKFISLGLRAEHQNLIATNYSDNAQERDRRKAYFREEFKRWSFPIEI